MQVFKTIAETRAALYVARSTLHDKDVQRTTSNGQRVALVPTMGALHAGHLSLVARARAENDFVIASLFVNPTQFAPGEDFDRYPRQFERDAQLFASAGVDLLFAPPSEEMYPNGATTTIDVGDVGTRLDGAHRPGHFLGVATVVAKLFHILEPQRAYFGQKDAVQVAVLRRMVRDLNFPLELIACPIIRDPDGLALSSRNAYLSQEERAAALTLSRALEAIREALAAGRPDPLEPAFELLDSHPSVVLEYLEAVNPDTLLPQPPQIPGTLIAVAARIGKTRLIDNMLNEPEDKKRP